MKLSDFFVPAVLATAVASCSYSDGSPNRAGTAAVGAIGGAIVGGVIGDAIGGSQQRTYDNNRYGGYNNNQGGYYPPSQPQYRVCQDRRGRQYYCLNAEGDQEQLFKHEEGAFDKEFQDRLRQMPGMNLGS